MNKQWTAIFRFSRRAIAVELLEMENRLLPCHHSEGVCRCPSRLHVSTGN